MTNTVFVKTRLELCQIMNDPRKEIIGKYGYISVGAGADPGAWGLPSGEIFNFYYTNYTKSRSGAPLPPPPSP